MIQEQFATQLINEFYQIFRIENVECWVNITDFTDNNTLVDFSPVNYDNDGTFNLYINGNGYMGIYFYLNDIYYETTNINIELNPRRG